MISLLVGLLSVAVAVAAFVVGYRVATRRATQKAREDGEKDRRIQRVRILNLERDIIMSQCSARATAQAFSNHLLTHCAGTRSGDVRVADDGTVSMNDEVFHRLMDAGVSMD